MSAVTLPIAMRWSDMDAYGHVNNTAFFRYTEEARIQALHLIKANPDTGTLVVRNEMEYVVPLEYHLSGLQVDVWVTRLAGAGFDLGYEIATTHTGERVVHARAATTMVTYDFPSSRPRRLNDGERADLEVMSGPPVAFRRRG